MFFSNGLSPGHRFRCRVQLYITASQEYMRWSVLKQKCLFYEVLTLHMKLTVFFLSVIGIWKIGLLQTVELQITIFCLLFLIFLFSHF